MAMNEPYFGPEIDNWCLGVILFRLSTGQDPFGQFKNDDNIKIAIRDGLFSVPSRIPQELRRTIYTLMDVRRGTRYSLWNLLDNDDWFCGRRNNEAPEYVRPIVSPCWQPEASRRNLGSETTIQIPSAPEAKTAIPHDIFSVYPLPMLLDERGKPSAELRPAPCVRVRTTAQQFHPLIKNFDKATAFLRKDSGRARFTKFFRKLWGCRVKLQYEAQPSCGAAELRELIETALTSDGAACRTKHDGTLVCSIAVPKADFKKPAAYGPLPPCWRRAPTTPHPTVGVSPAQKAEAMQQYASSLRPKHATIKCQLPEMKTAVVNLKVSGGSIKASLRKGSSGVYFSALRDLATNLHDSRSR
ncbi:MAG: hypothetical protein BJ554DRAFT_5650 [Olpidium bornovanus]|uniref:Protein kinase domain-containing protein n=1 Tax=Olpidium bornovanus TaxID=278681 RepID=A0A8H8A2D0_9FUNG|nr:MAG: hypothetical protein BJ554DRAFT_5650 [Olpidium bornovanus]